MLTGPRSEFNIDKGSSDPCFPEVLVQHAMYSGVAGNTLNMFLRCVSQSRAAMPDKLKQVTGAGGHFSVEGLRAVDPIFADAVVSGVPWIVLAAQIRSEEPGALKIIQAAENMLGSVQRLTSQVQLINRMCSMLSDSSVLATMGVDGLKDRLVKQAPTSPTTSTALRRSR
jgi:hypothetical protein